MALKKLASFPQVPWVSKIFSGFFRLKFSKRVCSFAREGCMWEEQDAEPRQGSPWAPLLGRAPSVPRAFHCDCSPFRTAPGRCRHPEVLRRGRFSEGGATFLTSQVLVLICENQNGFICFVLSLWKHLGNRIVPSRCALAPYLFYF